MRREQATNMIRHGLGPALLAALCCLAACSPQKIGLPYPSERIVYPGLGDELTRLHIASVTDRRPEDQRRGQGHFVGITFPADANWEPPVTDLYRQALAQDIAQTQLAELTPLPSQAEFVLEAVVHSFHCRMKRSGPSFLLPPAVGMLGGFLWGDDTSSRLKRGAVLSVVALGLVPVPLEVRAEAEVEMILRDARGEVVWREVCIGDIEDRRAVPATARPDKQLAERYLPQAVKRCNACLLGQLRQFLYSRSVD
jgi:hypothetical protein